jgi:signal transduction histidine kinase
MQVNESLNDSPRGSLGRPALDGVVVLAHSAGVANGAPRAFGTSVLHGASAPIALTWVEIPLVGSNGEVSGVMYRTATRPETGGMLVARRSEGSRSVGDVDQFVVHDINNIFAVITSGLRLLECQDDARYRRAIVGKMEEAITRGALLSRQLLETARLRDRSVDCVVDGDRFASMVATFNQALGTDIAVRTEIDPDLWDINADPEELYFALMNLGRNSADALLRGGAITVAARNIEASGSAVGEAVEIIVAADGGGMSNEVLLQALNPYFTTKPPGRNSGLGLPQVQHFAARRGGAVGIESKEGAGTRVRLVLPRVNTAEVPSSIVAGDIGYRPTPNGGIFYVVNPPSTPSAE